MRYLKNIDMIKGTILTGYLLIILIANIGIASANGEDLHEEQTGAFPLWTYYAEIVEHSLIIIASSIAIVFLVRPYRTHKNEARQGIFWMITGLVTLLISQILTNLHHFYFFTFGIWNAVVHHALLFASIIFMISGFFKVLQEMKK